VVRHEGRVHRARSWGCSVKRQKMITVRLTEDEIREIASVIENGWDCGAWAQGRLNKDEIKACVSAGRKLGADIEEPDEEGWEM